MQRQYLPSEETCEEVFQIIEVLQKKSPRRPVTQKEVCDELKRQADIKFRKQAYDKTRKPILSERHVRRTFRRLRDARRIIRFGRGKYWLPEYLDRNIEYLKRQLELEKSFWGGVDELRIKKIAELEQKVADVEQYYEDMIERREILKKLKEKGL